MSHDVYLDVDFKNYFSLSIFMLVYYSIQAPMPYGIRITEYMLLLLSNSGVMPMIFASQSFCVSKINIFEWLINALANCSSHFEWIKYRMKVVMLVWQRWLFNFECYFKFYTDLGTSASKVVMRDK